MAMNLGNKVSFGFSAVVAGQKTSGNNEPQLIVNSTKGKFTVTSPVTRAMGVAVGEYIQFVNNIAQIEAAMTTLRLLLNSLVLIIQLVKVLLLSLMLALSGLLLRVRLCLISLVILLWFLLV